MLLLPPDMVALLAPFAPLFSQPVWRRIQVLVGGAILAPGRRLVSTALGSRRRPEPRADLHGLPSRPESRRLVQRGGQSHPAAPARGHLRRPWAAGQRDRRDDPGAAAGRRSPRPAATAIRCARVRSHFVTVRGLRRICATLVVPIPWAARGWALPFLTVLAPAERDAKRRRRCKPLPTWARQLIRQIHRWGPARRPIVAGDQAYAALELLDAVRVVATAVARLRLEARRFTPPPPRMPGQKGRPRLVGDRRPNLSQPVADEEAAGSRADSRWSAGTPSATGRVGPREAGGGLWLREEYRQARAARGPVWALQAPPYRAHVLSPARRAEALGLLRSGRTPRQVAEAFGVSYWVILRLLRRTDPALLPKQQPKLSDAQADEARALLATGWSLRKVGEHFGVSYGAVWRFVQRDRAADAHEPMDAERGGDTG